MPRDEHSIQKLVMEYLKKKGYFYWRNNTGVMQTNGRYVRFGEKGSPDIFLVIDGFLIALEIKDPKGKQSPEQKEYEKRIKEAGAEYYLITSLDQLKEYGI